MFLSCGLATRFAFPPRSFIARLRFGTHLCPVHFPFPLAQLLDVGSLREKRGHFAGCVFLLERVRRQSRELRTRARALVGTPFAMAIAATAPAPALLVAFTASGLRTSRLWTFSDALRLWLPLLRLQLLLGLRLLGLRWTLLSLRALLIRPALAARALIALLPAVPLLGALPALRPPLAAMLVASLLAAMLVAPLIAPLAAALAAMALLGTAFAALLRLLLATRLARCT